jgi:hypothetical protein
LEKNYNNGSCQDEEFFFSSYESVAPITKLDASVYKKKGLHESKVGHL